MTMKVRYFSVTLCALAALVAGCPGGDDDGDSSAGDTGGQTTGSDTDPTGGVLMLEECSLASACPTVSPNCDFDNCASDYASADFDCVFEALAASHGGTPARVDLRKGHMETRVIVMALGNGRAYVEDALTAPDVASLRECDLAEAAWFQGCVGNTEDDACYVLGSYYDQESCTDVDDPVCPGT
jgi:hypothetical protein